MRRYTTRPSGSAPLGGGARRVGILGFLGWAMAAFVVDAHWATGTGDEGQETFGSLAGWLPRVAALVAAYSAAALLLEDAFGRPVLPLSHRLAEAVEEHSLVGRRDALNR